MQLSRAGTHLPDPLDELRTAVADAAWLAQRPTAVPGLQLYVETAPTAPVPVLFEPVLYFAVQGYKQLLTDEATIGYGGTDLVICALHLPALARVVTASEREPYLAVELRLDQLMLSEMVRAVVPAADEPAAAVSVHPTPVAAFDPLTRLVRMAADRHRADVLADGAAREVLFHVLDGPHGPALAALANANSVVTRIGRATTWMAAHLDTPVDVERLARHVDMSVSSLHRNFKTITGTTPVAFHKRLRLHEARRLGSAGDHDVATIARSVGYVSASQFSRDYKLLFGTSPTRDFAALVS